MLYETMINGQSYYGSETSRFLQENLNQLPMGRILCFTDGHEGSAIYMASLGYDVTVVDKSLPTLTNLNYLARINGLEVTEVYDDVAHFDIGRHQWDGIVYLCHSNPGVTNKELLGRFLTGLKAKGVLMVETFVPRKLRVENLAVQIEQPLVANQNTATEGNRLKVNYLMERETVTGADSPAVGAVVQLIATAS